MGSALGQCCKLDFILGGTVDCALSLSRATVQAPWFCGARGYAQQLAGLMAWLLAQIKSIGWAP